MRKLYRRILEAAATAPNGEISYYELMQLLWPPDQFPRAYRRSVNGGPPGVAMVFGGALNSLRQDGYISRWHDQRFGQEPVKITSKGKKELQ